MLAKRASEFESPLRRIVTDDRPTTESKVHGALLRHHRWQAEQKPDKRFPPAMGLLGLGMGTAKTLAGSVATSPPWVAATIPYAGLDPTGAGLLIAGTGAAYAGLGSLVSRLDARKVRKSQEIVNTGPTHPDFLAEKAKVMKKLKKRGLLKRN